MTEGNAQPQQPGEDVMGRLVQVGWKYEDGDFCPDHIDTRRKRYPVYRLMGDTHEHEWVPLGYDDWEHCGCGENRQQHPGSRSDR